MCISEDDPGEIVNLRGFRVSAGVQRGEVCVQGPCPSGAVTVPFCGSRQSSNSCGLHLPGEVPVLTLCLLDDLLLFSHDAYFIFAGLVNLFGKQGEGQGHYWRCALRPSDLVCLLFLLAKCWDCDMPPADICACLARGDQINSGCC